MPNKGQSSLPLVIGASPAIDRHVIFRAVMSLGLPNADQKAVVPSTASIVVSTSPKCTERDKDGLLPKQMEHYLCPRPVERVIALSANAKMERNRRYK